MAVQSIQPELGTSAPDFELTDVVHGRRVSRRDYEGQPLLVMFLCAHCPYVRHVEQQIASLARDHADSDLAIVAICPNDPVASPQDSPELLREQAEHAGFSFPYVTDHDQSVARAYSAGGTPDFFLYNRSHQLAYRGRLDGSSPGNDLPVTGEELRAAVEAVLRGDTPSGNQVPSMGCSIKWKE